MPVIVEWDRKDWTKKKKKTKTRDKRVTAGLSGQYRILHPNAL